EDGVLAVLDSARGYAPGLQCGDPLAYLSWPDVAHLHRPEEPHEVPVYRRRVVRAGGQFHAVVRQPHRLDIVLERLPSPAGIMPQPGASVHLRCLPRRVRVGLPAKGTGRDFMPTEIAVIGGVPRPAVLASPPAREAQGSCLPRPAFDRGLRST